MTRQCATKGFSALAALLASCMLALILAACMPARAWALFYDFNEADPYSGAASRGNWNSLLASMGDVILPQDIPDGTYTIDAATTSNMCWIFPTASDCSARYHDGEWGHCTLQVSGGTMTVYFYISQAYTHLYWGTAAEAASVTDITGCDASNYISGIPDTGYVPHYFALTIPALNWPMDLATYGGNEQLGFEGHVWWNRVIVFKATQEIYDAINGSSVTPEPQPGPIPSDPDDGGTDYSDLINHITEETEKNNQAIENLDGGTDDGSGSGGQPVAPGSPDDPESDGSGQYDDIIERLNDLVEGVNSGGAAPSGGSTPADGVAGEEATAPAAATQESVDDGGKAASPKSGSVIVPVTFDQLRQTDGSGTVKTTEETPQELGGLSIPQLVGLTAVGILVLGVLVRVGIFLFSKRN